MGKAEEEAAAVAKARGSPSEGRGGGSRGGEGRRGSHGGSPSGGRGRGSRGGEGRRGSPSNKGRGGSCGGKRDSKSQGRRRFLLAAYLTKPARKLGSYLGSLDCCVLS